jgi:NAD+ diphosphatase
MSGFYARASETQPIRVDLDNELAGVYSFFHFQMLCHVSSDARWFTREEVLRILEPEATTRKLGESIDTIRAFDKIEGSTEQEVKAQDDAPFKIPPLTAIAGVLIRDWASGKHPHLTSSNV